MNVAVRFFAVDDRAEKVLPATKAWREAARVALDALPRGGYARCAEAAECSPGTLSQLLNGEIDASPFVGPISEFLGIALPHQETLDDDEAEIREMLKAADPDSKRLVRDMLRRLTAH